MDNAGATLYSERQMDDVLSNLKENLYCNPHTSQQTEDQVNAVRDEMLNFFNTRSSEYELIFTRGATDSLQTVARCFDFQTNGHFLYLRNAHNSVVGMRSVVNTPNVSVIDVEEFVKMAVDEEKKHVPIHSISNSLVTYPAQCNFNGYKYPLSLIDKFHNVDCLPVELQQRSKHWFVCLDAANFVASSFLDLTKYKPDFVAFSFYKIFGYPTGLGALLVSKRGARVLNKTYHGGGTIEIALSSMNFKHFRKPLHERFEDGTIPFLSIISLKEGAKTIARLVPERNGLGSMERISHHCFNLGKYLYNELDNLKHPSNGRKVIQFYNQTAFESKDQQGGIVNFNVVLANGQFIGYSEIECLADLHGVYLRVGCFCNPGACQSFLGLTNNQAIDTFTSGHTCGGSHDVVNNRPLGFVRLSFGYMNSKKDVEAFVKMINSTYVGSVQQKRIISTVPKQAKLTHICVYPVRSCGPLVVGSSWTIARNKLKYDKDWTIVNEFGIEVKTTKDVCKIRPVVNERKNLLRLSYPNMEPINISLTQQPDTNIEHKIRKMGLGERNDNVLSGLDCGDEVAAWLQRALKTPGLRLSRQILGDKKRGVYQIEKLADPEISYQPLTLVNVVSVQRFLEDSHCSGSEKILDDLVWSFRPNLIVMADEANVEKEWDRVRIGEMALKVGMLK